MFLTDISLKRPVFITVIIIALLAMGIVSYTGLSLNSMPDVDPAYVSVTIILPGASPDQVESKVSKKVEESTGQISGVRHLSTTISEGVSTTTIEFELEKSSSEALQEVRDKISFIRGDLPTDIQEPIISKFDMTAQPIMSLAVTGPLENRELSKLIDDVIKKKLATVNGVGSVNVYGNEEREIQVKLNKEKIAAYGLTTSEVVNRFKMDNLDIPSGKLSDYSSKMTVRTDGKINKVSDFYDIRVAERNGVEIRVKDIAEVIDSVKEKESLSYFKGKDAISLDIVKQSGGNTVNIAKAIKAELNNIQKDLPTGVKIDIISDNSSSINNTVNSVLKTLIEGCVLAVIIVYLFLGNLRITAISAISLPTSIVTTFIALKLMNFSLNMMTLIALSLAVGLLIDDAIVVLENIVRHLHLGKSPMQAAKDGTSEIGLAVTATTLAVVAVFLPVAMVKGMIGQYFMQFGLTVVFSLLVSLFVSFTLVPVMSAKFVKYEEGSADGLLGRFLNWFNRCFDQFANAYSQFLKIVLNHRMVTLALVAVIFIGSLGIFTQLKTAA
ncbi:MAG: cation/multidrug efflux pump, partial [Clostridiales bacterium]|nr:cation/multidrug efflux pump [Clostridiales bacterium]